MWSTPHHIATYIWWARALRAAGGKTNASVLPLLAPLQSLRFEKSVTAQRAGSMHGMLGSAGGDATPQHSRRSILHAGEGSQGPRSRQELSSTQPPGSVASEVREPR